MNGRAALAAGKDEYTSGEEEEEVSSHKFRPTTDKAETVKILLESMIVVLTVCNCVAHFVMRTVNIFKMLLLEYVYI